MGELVLTSAQLAQKANDFANEFCQGNISETEQIIAGMTAVISENESALEQMKKQKWFEQIWFTLTGKNKATVEEMKQKHDLLTKYTIIIMQKMLGMISGSSQMIMDLYRSISIVCCENNRISKDIGELVDVAELLNEKINSIDTYNNLITDIQNGKKYDISTPLLSLRDVMSSVDERTARDSDKICRIRQTMEKNGFDFSISVNAKELAEQVLSMPEENVGRIYLFCQKLASQNMMLAYICRLIENFFYLSRTDREIVLENGNAVTNALIYSGLNEDTKSNISNMFMDIADNLPDRYLDQIVESSTKSYDCNPSGIKLMIMGKDGSDASELCETLVRDYRINARVEYGLDVGNISKEVINKIQQKIAEDGVNCLLYCVSSFGGRFEKAEADIINYFKSKPGLNVVVAVTQCISSKYSNKLSGQISKKTQTEPVLVLLKDTETNAGMVSAFGIIDVVERITKR